MITAVTLFDAGFNAMVSVVPPNATISEMSKISAADAGKVPGRRNSYGTWGGYNWLQYIPTRTDVERWLGQGANIGLAGSAFPALDIDITDPEAADAAQAAVERVCGPCLVRHGNRPKVLVMFRSDEPMQSFDMPYTREMPLLGPDRQVIQFLANGRQYVISGIHPKTMAPYSVDDPLGAMTDGPSRLPLMTPDLLVEVFDAIRDALAEFGFSPSGEVETRLAGELHDQKGLQAPDMETLARFVQSLPNTTPDRHEYVAIGYAIKGASQADPEAGRAIWHEWCSRWELGGNDLEQVDRDWDKMVPPYRTGFSWLLDEAKHYDLPVAEFEFGLGSVAEVEHDLLGPPPADELASAMDAVDRIEGRPSAFSDSDLAQRFVNKHGDRCAFVPETGVGYHWDDQKWVKEKSGSLFNLVWAFCDTLAPEVPIIMGGMGNEAQKVMAKLGSAGTMEAVTRMVQRHVRVMRNLADMDSDPDVLNTPNGPLYLPTGEALDPETYGKNCFKMTATAPGTLRDCPRWLTFVQESMGSDREMIEYLQVLAGYALTGHVKEQIFPFFIGAGGNGKSRFIEALSGVMGTYAKTAPASIFQLQRGGGGSTDYYLAELAGARLVTTNETKSGSTWDEQRVKQLTGEDLIDARMPYGRPFSYAPQCTLIVVGNYAPDLEAVGDAIARRIHMVTWNNSPAKPDKSLGLIFDMEMPGILAWAIEGAKKWYAKGLVMPRAMQVSTEEYLIESDVIGVWIAQGLSVTNNRMDVMDGTSLYACYQSWMLENYRKPVPRKEFDQYWRLKAKKMSLILSRGPKNGKQYHGLKPQAASMPANVTPIAGYRKAVDEHKGETLT